MPHADGLRRRARLLLTVLAVCHTRFPAGQTPASIWEASTLTVRAPAG